MLLIQIPVGPMQNFTYVMGDEDTGLAAVVDPSWDLDKVMRKVSENNLKIQYIINTHAHHDHVMGNHDLASKTGAKIIMHEKASMQKDIAVRDGDAITLGGLKIKVIHTPGHSPEGICLAVKDKLITGDTLFVGECGRTDIGGGSPEDMYDSLLNKIRKLDDNFEVYPGHDYGEKPFSTLGYEKKHNYTLKPRTRGEFIKFMNE